MNCFHNDGIVIILVITILSTSSNNNTIPRYKLDFEMFGYSPDDYIKMGKPGPDDVVVAPLVNEENKNEENKPESPESPNEEVDVAESELLPKVDFGETLERDKRLSETIQDEPTGKST